MSNCDVAAGGSLIDLAASGLALRAPALLRNIAAETTSHQSMIPKKPGPDVIRAGYRFSEKMMLQQ